MGIFIQIRAILLLPMMVTVVVPSLIIYLTSTLNLGWDLSSPWNLGVSAVGIFFIALGVLLATQTIRLLIVLGNGTLAPWDPTQHLVVHGVYRHVRNPMISGVSGILLGEAILFGSLSLLAWFIIFVTVNLLYIPVVEEPGLARRFGNEYQAYQQNVPRWIPRLKPWHPNSDDVDVRLRGA